MADKAAKLNEEALVLLSMDTSKAAEKAAEALAAYKDAKDVAGMMDAYRYMISAKVSEAKGAEARQVATDAVDALVAADSAKGKAAAKLLLAEACMSTGKNSDALTAAKEAAALYKEAGDKDGMLDALQVAVSAELTNTEGGAVATAQERVDICKEMGSQAKEGAALLLLSQAHVTRIAMKLATCSIAAVDDTMAALTAAKDAHSILAEQGDREGMGSALEMMTRVLMYNNVPNSVIENLSDPQDVYQDVLSGKYSTPTNGFPAKPLPKTLKIEEVVPTSKQLERGKFTWMNPTAGFVYTLIWQAVKERNIPNKLPRGSYDIMALNTQAKTMSLSNCFTAMSNDAAERNSSMVVYMTSHNSAQAYGTQMITQTATLAAMITARLSKVTFVQFGESHVDWTDTRCRQVAVYPVTLALMRSCRIEAPTVNIGYVAGDACSWVADPAPLIESMFDTLESDECEMMYKRGENFAPLIIHRSMEDGVAYCKPKKPNTFLKN